jgi:hypothetical protein
MILELFKKSGLKVQTFNLNLNDSVVNVNDLVRLKQQDIELTNVHSK